MSTTDPFQTLGAALQAVIEHAVTAALAAAPTPSSGEPVMISVPEAAEQLGVGTTKVKQLIASGRLASVTIGRRRLVPTASLQALADSGGQDIA
jgi:excisionase family DNA binding protein